MPPKFDKTIGPILPSDMPRENELAQTVSLKVKGVFYAHRNKWLSTKIDFAFSEASRVLLNVRNPETGDSATPMLQYHRSASHCMITREGSEPGRNQSGLSSCIRFRHYTVILFGKISSSQFLCRSIVVGPSRRLEVADLICQMKSPCTGHLYLVALRPIMPAQ